MADLPTGMPSGAYIAAIDDALRHAFTLDAVMAVLRVAARELTGADGVTVVLRDGDLCYYAEEYAIGPLWKGRRFPMNDCVSGWAMIHRQRLVIPDIYQDPRIPRSAYEPTFVKALAMVPIRPSNPLGAIGAYWGRVRAAHAGELDALERLAHMAEDALERVLTVDARGRLSFGSPKENSQGS